MTISEAIWESTDVFYFILFHDRHRICDRNTGCLLNEGIHLDLDTWIVPVNPDSKKSACTTLL